MKIISLNNFCKNLPILLLLNGLELNITTKSEKTNNKYRLESFPEWPNV